MAVGFDKFDVENERERLRKLSDAEPIREGKAARYMCSPATNSGKPPLEVYVIGLRLCKKNGDEGIQKSQSGRPEKEFQ